MLLTRTLNYEMINWENRLRNTYCRTVPSFVEYGRYTDLLKKRGRTGRGHGHPPYQYMDVGFHTNISIIRQVSVGQWVHPISKSEELAPGIHRFLHAVAVG